MKLSNKLHKSNLPKKYRIVLHHFQARAIPRYFRDLCQVSACFYHTVYKKITCYQKFHLGKSEIMQFLSLERLEKTACYSEKSSLIATKFRILNYLRIILSISQKSKKSLCAFLLKTALKKKRYLSV